MASGHNFLNALLTARASPSWNSHNSTATALHAACILNLLLVAQRRIYTCTYIHTIMLYIIHNYAARARPGVGKYI